MKTCIVSVVYYEPQWLRTVRAIEATGLPVFLTDRNGVGNLAKALNQGFSRVPPEFDLVWFLTNPVFDPAIARDLIEEMENPWAAVSPAFASDHKHIQPNGGQKTLEVPFVEFTGPIVRRDVFSEFPLDETMPYAGHDLDWGLRVRQAGHRIGVKHATVFNHAYVRHMDRGNAITKDRQHRRKLAVSATGQRMTEKWGPNWRDELQYQGAI